MIDISFLTPPSQLKRLSGMEYIDYQGKAFYNALTVFASEIYDSTTEELNWDRDNREKLSTLIKQYNNMRVIVNPVDVDNFGITAGFISPGNVLNAYGIETYFQPQYSQIGYFFAEFKKKALVGWCDLKTGKVEGDFKNIAFDLVVPKTMFVSNDILKKVNKNGSVPALIAGAILHELGHVFFGLHGISSKVLEDIFFARTAVEVNAEKDMAKKVKVAMEFKKETGIDVIDDVKKTGELTTVSFEKGLAEREHIRTLSLGTSIITIEVLANAYAVRMGASVAIAGLFASFANADRSIILMRLTRLVAYTALSAAGLSIFYILPLFALGYGIGLGKKLKTHLVNADHETSYRTIKSALRDIIALIRTNREKGDKATVAELMKDAILIEKMADEAKPFLEGTTVQRLFSIAFNGTDAKKADVETYTAELNYNPLSLHTDFTR